MYKANLWLNYAYQKLWRSYMQAEKLAWHCFLDKGKRRKSPESGAEDFISHRKSTSYIHIDCSHPPGCIAQLEEFRWILWTQWVCNTAKEPTRGNPKYFIISCKNTSLLLRGSLYLYLISISVLCFRRRLLAAYCTNIFERYSERKGQSMPCL